MSAERCPRDLVRCPAIDASHIRWDRGVEVRRSRSRFARAKTPWYDIGGAEMDRKYMAIEHLADERLRAARRERGMTQIDVADQMAELGFPWSQPTVARVERGRRRLSLAEAHALMDILEQDQ